MVKLLNFILFFNRTLCYFDGFLNGILSSFNGNPDFKMGAFAHFGFNVNFAAKQVDETFDDRHPIAAAFSELVDAHKRLEHLFQFVFRNANACIHNVENNQIAAQSRFETDAALQRELNAVGNQIAEYLFDFQRVG